MIILGVTSSIYADLILLSGDSQSTAPASIDNARLALQKGDLTQSRNYLAAHCRQLPDSPNRDVLLAGLLIDAKQIPLAKGVLTELLLTPEAAFESHFALSRIAFMEQRWADAWAHCRIAEIEERPKTWSPSYLESVERSLRRHKAEIAYARKDWDVALPLLQRLLDVTEDAAPIYRSIARIFFERGEVEQASNTFKRAAEIDQLDEIPFQVRLARLHLAEGKIDLAEECFKHSIGENSLHPSTGKVVYAEWLINQNRPQEVESLLLSMSDDAKHQSQRDLLLGMAYRMQQDYQAAEEVFTKLHQSETSSLNIGNQLALVLIESQDEGKRARALQIASANFRRIKNESTVSTLAWIQYRLGDVSSAGELFIRLANSSQLSPDSAFYFSEILRSTGRVTEARQLAELARKASGPRFAKSR
ncbi:MAG: hypothetical protein Aurels2KO_48040 [Aureliella sp.]